MKIINLEEFQKHCNYFKEINNVKLKDIVIIKNGKEIFLSKDQICEFEFTGLSNKDAIDLEIWDW